MFHINQYQIFIYKSALYFFRLPLLVNCAILFFSILSITFALSRKPFPLSNHPFIFVSGVSFLCPWVQRLRVVVRSWPISSFFGWILFFNVFHFPDYCILDQIFNQLILDSTKFLLDFSPNDLLMNFSFDRKNMATSFMSPLPYLLYLYPFFSFLLLP